MFKVVVEQLFNNRYGKSSERSFIVLSKPIAIKRAAVLAKHSCVEVLDHQGQIIAHGDPVIGFREVNTNEHN